MKSFINKHINKILKNHAKQTDTTNNDLRKCYCRRPDDCPTGGKCLTQSVVYQADVTTHDNQEKKIYVGVTANEFKDRYRNHMKSFRNEKYSCDTELSKYIWKLKTAKRNFDMKWSLIKRVRHTKLDPRDATYALKKN